MNHVVITGESVEQNQFQFYVQTPVKVLEQQG